MVYSCSRRPRGDCIMRPFSCLSTMLGRNRRSPRTGAAAGRRQPSRGRPRLEQLEDRCVPTVFMVNSNLFNMNADGKVTLLEAVTAANNDAPAGDAPAGGFGNDIIQFDPSLNGQTITFNGSGLAITDSLAITGPGPDLLTISGFNTLLISIFDFFPSQINVSISGLTL